MGDPKVTPTKRVIDHLANFHNPARIRARFAIDRQTKDNVIVLQPSRIIGSGCCGIVYSRNARAWHIGGVISATIDWNASPCYQSPVNIAFNKQPIPAVNCIGINGAFGIQVADMRRNIPGNQVISDFGQ